MNPLYNTGIRLMKWGMTQAAKRNGKASDMVHGQSETFDIIKEKINPDDCPVWIHAASLGEFEQARPLIETIRKEYGTKVKILLSFFSPSGYNVRKNYPLVDCVVYLPFDTPENARRFVHEVNPRLAVFAKYDFWGNYLQQLRSRCIPTAVISSIFRSSQSFFKPWGGMFRNMLKAFSAGIYVQDVASQKLLQGIGFNSIVAGDTRFDRVTAIMNQTSEFPTIENFAKGNKVIIMGSSWQPDEDVVIPYFNTHRDIKLIIAPHEFDENRLKQLEQKIKRSAVRYSTINPGDSIDADCLIIDCFGILSSCYRYADIAYIGGGFGAGIHNINEAAVYYMPIVFGPKYHKFKEARDLIAAGGAKVVNSASDFALAVDTWLTNSAYLENAGNIAGNYIKSNIGATEKIFSELKQYI